MPRSSISTSNVTRAKDVPETVLEEGRRRMSEAALAAVGVGDGPKFMAYNLLLGLSSHDISAMRELIGMPKAVLAATQRNGGRVITASFDYGHFVCNFETAVDRIPHFDAHLEVVTPTEIIRIDYDTPYIRHLPARADGAEAARRGGHVVGYELPDPLRQLRRRMARFPRQCHGAACAQDLAHRCAAGSRAVPRHDRADGLSAARSGGERDAGVAVEHMHVGRLDADRDLLAGPVALAAGHDGGQKRAFEIEHQLRLRAGRLGEGDAEPREG